MTPLPAIRQLVLAVWLGCISTLVFADDLSRETPDSKLPGIALIIDDLGNQRGAGKRVLALPGPIACAFLPHGPYTRTLAEQAFSRHKEVMLHLPMQAVDHERAVYDKGVLTLDMTRRQFLETLSDDIAAVPHVSGLNNHMGSLLTRHPGHMEWLMQAISDRGGLFFVDSRTTTATVAQRLAQEHSIPNIERKVFLDNDPDPAAIRRQFRLLIATARREGTALGIGHPYPGTLDILSEELEKLEHQGIQLLPVSRLIELQNERKLAWQASSSR